MKNDGNWDGFDWQINEQLVRKARKATLYDKNENILQLLSGTVAISQFSYFV